MKKYINMKKYILLFLISIVSISISANSRKYLLHTDANITRLKEQIKNDPEVKQAWDHQLKKAEDMLKRDRSGAPDLQELSLIHISEPTRLGMISYAVFC